MHLILARATDPDIGFEVLVAAFPANGRRPDARVVALACQAFKRPLTPAANTKLRKLIEYIGFSHGKRIYKQMAGIVIKQFGCGPKLLPEAARRGWVDVVKWILRRLPHPPRQGTLDNALFTAARNSDIGMLECLLPMRECMGTPSRLLWLAFPYLTGEARRFLVDKGGTHQMALVYGIRQRLTSTAILVRCRAIFETAPDVDLGSVWCLASMVAHPRVFDYIGRLRSGEITALETETENRWVRHTPR